MKYLLISNNRKSNIIKLFALCLIFVGFFMISPPKVSAAARNEGKGCFKDTGYVNTVVVVRILDENGNFVRFSESFAFQVTQKNTTGLYIPSSVNGIGQEADGALPDGKRWKENSRAAPFAAKSQTFNVNKNYNSSSICNIFGINATSQVFGDRFTDGHPFLSCAYGAWSSGPKRGLGFRFDALGIYDTGGRAGFWKTKHVNKYPKTQSEDINNDSTNIVFDWQYEKPTIEDHARLTIDQARCDLISGWAYDYFLAKKGTSVSVHIYVDGPPGRASHSVALTANQPRSDLNATNTNTGMFWINGNYGFSMDPRSHPSMAGLDLSKPHILNFYIPNVPGQGSKLAAVRTMNPANCKNVKSDFSITPTGTTTLDDPEDPTKVNFSGKLTSTYKVKGIDVSCKYTQIKSGVSSSIGSDDSDSNATLNKSYNCDEEVDLSSAGLTAGDEVCQVITATPGSGKVNSAGTVSSPGAVISKKICATLINQPFISFYGGDVRAGSDFGSPCSPSGSIVTYNKSDSTYRGSGAQLAVIAYGNIEQFASAKYRSTNPVAPKGLTFANTGGSAFGGNFGFADCIPDYFSDKGDLALNGGSNIDLSTSPASGNYYYRNNVNLSGDLQVGSRYNIFIEGDLTIDNNISYVSNSWADFTKVPSLHVFVKGNINIKKNVNVITGYFVAQPNGGSGGIVNTCSDGTVPLWNSCRSQLVVNGSITADKVDFRKVINSIRDDNGATSAANSKASEVFSLSPEQWIVRPTLLPGETSQASKYDYITVLPPIL